MTTEDVLLTKDDIQRVIQRIAYEIVETRKSLDKLALVGIHTRGVFIAKRIQAAIQEIVGLQIASGNIDITLYRDDWTRITPHPIVQATNISFSTDGKQIVLVDDVLYTGRTIRAAMDAIIDFGRPDRIELAVLIDRGHRELPIQANYIGKKIKTRQTETVNVMLTENDGLDQVVLKAKVSP